MDWLITVGIVDYVESVNGAPGDGSPEDIRPVAEVLADPSGANKKKYHRCNKCELPVAQRYERPAPELLSYHLVLKDHDDVFLPQSGPVCGAASVAGTVLSLLRQAGHDIAAPQIRDAVTVRFVQDVYHRLGVPNIYETSAAVGNLTIKKCAMALRIPSLPSLQLTVRDFGSRLDTDPVQKRLSEWNMLKRGVASGARYLYHSRNHYNRIFGWRELWSTGTPAPASPADVDADLPFRRPATAAACHVQNENADPLADDAAAKLSFGEAPTITASAADRPIRPLTASKRNILLAPSSRLSKPLAAARASPAAPEPDYTSCVAKRQVLMAKKGQRPQHWVDWDAVCDDIASHRGHHIIFEFRLVDRARG